jgi:ABC-type nitrate/sulfonate/bicarbonate transport system substrate-binding protein
VLESDHAAAPQWTAQQTMGRQLPMLDRRFALLRLLAAAVAPWPLGSAPRSARAQAGLQPIRMGIQIFTGAVATVWVEKKIYDTRGLVVDAKQMADGRSVRDAMVAGQLNVGTMNITPFIVGAAASGLVMAGVVSLGGDTVGVMVRKGAGISGIADLKGRRIGISVGSTTGNIFVRTVAPQAGLRPSDYQVINMRPADQVAALAAGSVDAITSFEPYMTVAETAGIGVTLLRFGAIDPNPTCLVVTPGLLADPASMTAFLKSWLDGVAYWRSHAADVADVLVQLAGSAGYAHVTKAVAETLVQQIKVEPDITPALADHIKREAEQMKAANLIRALPDWDKVLRPDLFAAVRANG